MCVCMYVWYISFYKSLNVESSLFRNGFWLIKGWVDSLVALRVNQGVGITLSKLRLWAGERVFALHVKNDAAVWTEWVSW